MAILVFFFFQSTVFEIDTTYRNYCDKKFNFSTNNAWSDIYALDL